MIRLQTATLTGDARARGRAHAEIFAEQIRANGILDFYMGYCGRMVGPSSLPARVGVDFVHSWCARGLSDEARGLAEGFCEAIGYDLRDVTKALVMPDALNFLVGLHGAIKSVPMLGCTSLAAWGKYTPHGR